MFKWLNRFRRPERRYDSNGHLIYYDDRRGHVTHYYYNGNDQLIERVYNGYCELYNEYDDNGNLTYRSLYGEKEWWTYNEFGYLIRYVSSKGIERNIFYYKNGELIQYIKNGAIAWNYIGDNEIEINQIINKYMNDIPNAISDILGESI